MIADDAARDAQASIAGTKKKCPYRQPWPPVWVGIVSQVAVRAVRIGGPSVAATCAWSTQTLRLPRPAPWTGCR